MRFPGRRAGTRAAAIGMLPLLAITAARAQRVRPDNDGQGVPVATNRILQAPSFYYGKLVTLSAGVEQVLSSTAFVVDQQGKAAGAAAVKAIGSPMLVLAPYLTRPVSRTSYLIVRGEVVQFEPAAMIRVAPNYLADLSPETLEAFKGQPVLIANSVIDSTRAEIGKKPLPPPTPTELALAVVMKRIAPAFAGVQAAAKESNAGGAAEGAALLKPAFEQTEAIWDDLGQVAASEWARSAQESAARLEQDAKAGNWDGVKSAAGTLNRTCQSCHTAYRERLDDGSFRIKAGSF